MAKITYPDDKSSVSGSGAVVSIPKDILRNMRKQRDIIIENLQEENAAVVAWAEEEANE